MPMTVLGTGLSKYLEGWHGLDTRFGHHLLRDKMPRPHHADTLTSVPNPIKNSCAKIQPRFNTHIKVIHIHADEGRRTVFVA